MIGIALGWIVGIVCTNGINDKAAAKIAVTYMKAVGIRESPKLSGVNEANGSRWGLGESLLKQVTFTFPDKRFANILISPRGEIAYFQVVDPNLRGAFGRAPKGTNPAEMAKLLLLPAHPKGNYVLRAFPGSQLGPYLIAHFDMTVAGHRFFNLNPIYAYMLTFDAVNGVAYRFSKPLELPPVVSTVPKIGSSAATEMLEHWAKTNYRQGGGAAGMFAPTGFWNPTVEPDLGFYKFKDEPKARLVWQAHVWTHVKHLRSTEGGTLRILLDAVTGDLIEPDDPGFN